MSALGQGFPPSIQIGGPTQDPSAASGGQPGAPDNPDSEAALDKALDALNEFMSTEQDNVDKAAIAKCIAAIQGLLGSRQKGAEAALGIQASHKAMSRAASNGPSY